MTTKFIRLLLSLLATLAARDAARAARKQAKFKKNQQARAAVFRAEAERLQRKAARCAGEATRAAVCADFGNDKLSKCQREATALCESLNKIKG